MININGLRAIAQLADANSSIDLQSAASAVAQLAKSDVPTVRDNALAVQTKLARREASTAPK